MSTAMKDTHKKSTAASAQRRAGQRSGGLSAQVMKRGATIRAPVPSPSHQVSHRDPKLDQLAEPPRHRLMLPMVADSAVLSTLAVNVNFSTSMARLKGFLPPTKR